MNKYLLVSIIVVAVPFTAFASFSHPLSYGSNGTDVEHLQELLISQNCLSAEPTGYFGLLTLAGVECFQAKHGISATGYFDNLSIAQANSTIVSLGWEAEGQRAGFCTETEGSALGLLKLPD
jgi:peptidoglycan hydrolase-like protein with peptidoglycan-binding domain